MRHLALFFVLSLFAAFSSLAQTGSVQGKLIDSNSTQPAVGVMIQVNGTSIEAYTDSKGEFILENVPLGIGTLIFTSNDYEPKELEFQLNESNILNIGSVELISSNSTEAFSNEMPLVSIEESELEDEEGNQASGELLHSSDDVFSSTAAYTFGAARFRIRGYDQENSSVLFNGIQMGDIETGRTIWSDWGGLNDAVRNKEVIYASDNNDYSLTTVGGTANINTRASEFRPGVKASYMSTNRNYRNRVMATAATGLMDNNWAFAISGSHRWADEGYIDGTFYDAWAYFLAVEKVFNEKHSLALTAFVSPNKRGKQIGSTQEAYDYVDDNYYNANWGYQDGEKRNSRVANSNKPFISLNHYWTISDDFKINTSVAYSFGRNGNTALNWYDAKDPRPNYYKNLPYYNRDVENYTWDNQQVDWDFFYFANSKNLYTQQKVDGVDGNDVTFNRSKYMVEDRRIDHQQIQANTLISYKLNEEFSITGNVNYTWYKGRHYKLVDDLLGGDYWVDIDQFAERDFTDAVLAQSDLDNPNRLTKTGDVFGYDYDANIQKIKGQIKADYSYNQFDAYLGVELSNTSFYRTGNMRNGKFPEDSYGDSEKQNFNNYSVAAGVNYKITGRHILYGNAKYMTRAPYFDDAYVSPRTRDYVVDGLTSEKITSFDLNYILKLPYLTGRVSGYYTMFEDQTDVMSFYHDDANSFVNYSMTGIDKKHFGTEIGLEGKVTSTISVNAVAALGQYTYDSRPEVYITQDNNAEPLTETKQTVYVKDFYVDGTPQQAYSLGINYNAPKYWWIELSASYFDDMYLSFNPARRTQDAIVGLDATTDYGAAKIDEITRQEKLSGQFTVDLSGGKSWRFGNKTLRLHLGISNLLDNKKFITGGYEQLRFDYADQDVNKFSPVYFYMYGRNYMAILTFQF